MGETMEELLTYLVRALVENPDGVRVAKSAETDDTVTYQVLVDPADMGRVIGRQGRIAKAIRTVVKSVAAKEKKKVVVNIGD